MTFLYLENLTTELLITVDLIKLHQILGYKNNNFILSLSEVIYKSPGALTATPGLG